MSKRKEKLTPTQVNNIIRYDAYPKALRAMKGIRWINTNQQERTMTIGAGTSQVDTITVRPDGTISHESNTEAPPREVSLISKPRGSGENRDSIFLKAWTNVALKASERVTETAQEVLGKDDEENSVFPNIGLNLSMTRAIEKATRGITARIAGGYILDPDRYGRKVLQSILGKEILGETIRVVGHSATLQDINRIHRNREAVMEAHRQNPNAVVILFSEYHNNYHMTQPDLDLSSPQAILEQARQICNLYGEYYQDGTTRIDLKDKVWEQISQLNQAAIRTFPMNMWTIRKIAQIAAAAGVPPTYTAIRKADQEMGKVPSQVLAAYMRESHRIRTTRKGTQRELTGQLFHIAQAIQSSQWNCCPEHVRYKGIVAHYSNQNLTPADNIPDWETVTADLPRYTHHRNRRTQKAPTIGRDAARDLIEEIIRTGLGQELTGIAHSIVKIREIPQQSITLQVLGEKSPTIDFQLDTSGIIKENHQRGWIAPETIPGSPSDQRWTTQGIWAKAMTEHAARAITKDPRWKQSFPGRKPRTLQVHSLMLRYLDENGVPDQDTILSDSLARAVSRLIRGDIAMRASPDQRAPSIREYNLAACDPAAFAEARKTNPGAAEWVMQYSNPQEAIHHPGQVVSLARESMFQAGLERQNWKMAASLSGINLRRAMSWSTPEDAALILNIASGTSTVLSPQTVTQMTRYISWPSITCKNHGRENITLAITLACREICQAKPNMEQKTENRINSEFANVIDYVDDLNQRGKILQSRSWSGLNKASGIWHRQMRRDEDLAYWKWTMSQRTNGPMSWDSLIPASNTDDGLSIVPLTKEEDLRDETIRMAHCLISYGPKCAQGNSRIFSIRKKSETLATGEILRNRNGWEVSQVRGFMNQSVNSRLENIMKSIALAYTEADQKMTAEGR